MYVYVYICKWPSGEGEDSCIYISSSKAGLVPYRPLYWLYTLFSIDVLYMSKNGVLDNL